MTRKKRSAYFTAELFAFGLFWVACSSSQASEATDPSLCTILMTKVESQYEYAGSNVTLDNLESYIELPLRAPIREMLKMNLPTYTSSANRHDIALAGDDFYDGIAYSEIGLVLNQLSKKNKLALNNFFNVEIDDPRVGHEWSSGGEDIHHPQFYTKVLTTGIRKNLQHGFYAVFSSGFFGEEYVNLYIPMDAKNTAAEISEKWMNFIKIFSHQNVIPPLPPPDFKKLIKEMEKDMEDLNPNTSRFFSWKIPDQLKKLMMYLRKIAD